MILFSAPLLLCALALKLLAAEPVAKVGDTSITTEQLRQTIARHGYNVYDEQSVKKSLEDEVRFELLAAEARRLGYDKDPETSRRIKELLVDRITREKVVAAADVNFPEAELRAYYAARTNDFRKPTVVRGLVLTVYVRDANQDDALRKAGEALRDWKAGEKPEDVIRKYSDDPSERVGTQGSAFVEGQPSRRYPQEVATAMFGLKSRGDVAGPIQTTRGVYLVSLNERLNGSALSFEQVKRDIQRVLAQQQRDQAYAAYCDSLKKQHPVTVNETELKKAIQSASSNAGPPPGPPGPP